MTVWGRLGLLAVLLSGLSDAACSGNVRIGAVISQSGALAFYGQRVKNGLDLAARELNAAGGGAGRPIELIYRDDATNENRGRQVVHELIEEERVNLIIGAVSSPVTLGIAPMCEQQRVILLSPSASAPKISQAGDYIYRVYPSDVLEGAAMAKFARDLGLRRLVIFALAGDFGQGLEDVFVKHYTGRDRQVLRTFKLEDRAPQALRAMVHETAGLNPDGIYIISYMQELTALLRQIQAAGLHAVLLGSSSVTRDLVRLAGSAAENLVYPQPVFDVDSPEPAVASFVAAYRAMYHEDPDIYAAHGYDALRLLIRAIEIGGSTRSDAVRDGFNRIRDYEGAAGRTVFDEHGDVVRYPRMFVIQRGVSMPLERYVEEGGSLTGAS